MEELDYGLEGNATKATRCKKDIVGAVPSFLRDILNELAGKGHQVHVVGGAARDILSGREPRDWDLATSALPSEVFDCFSGRYEVLDIGMKHGTVTVVAGGHPVEITTFRTEMGYSDRRRPDGVRFVDDVRADLARRDFTVNAIALEWPNGLVRDPFSGLRDLRKGLVRAVGTPHHRFSEDPLRILRAVRLASEHGWRIERLTRKAMKDTSALIAQVSVERVRDELQRICVSPWVYDGLWIAVDSGLIPHVLPRFGAAMAEASSKGLDRWLRIDFTEHALLAASLVSPKLHLRFAALLHDVGKPYASSLAESGPRFHGHDDLGAEIARDELARLRVDSTTRDRAVLLIKEHMFCYGPPFIGEAGIRRLIIRVGRENVADLLELRESDIRASRGSPGPLFQELKARIESALRSEEPLSRRDLAVDGRDVMAALDMPPGPEVGMVLKELMELVIDDPTLNCRRKLIAAMPDVFERIKRRT